MSDELARRPAGAIITQTLPRELLEEAARNARRSLSEASKRAYATSWARFEGWCRAHGLVALPADETTIVTYLTAAAAGYELAGEKVAPLKYRSLERLYAALRVRHEEAGHPLDTLKGVRNTLKAIGRNTPGGIAPKEKKGFRIEHIVAAIEKLGSSPVDVRAKAVLLFGWWIGQRRSNIAGLQVGDVEFTADRAIVTIGKRKTDQLGEKPHVIMVGRRRSKFCAVSALEEWLAIRRAPGDDPRLLGVSVDTVNAIVKRAAASLGLNPREYGAHSLRRGFVTSSSRAGKDTPSIMKVTGHKDIKQLLRYIEKDPTRDIAGEMFAKYDDEEEEVEDNEKVTVTVEEVTHNGQQLVDRRAAQEMKRRIVSKPDFTKDGAPCDVVWLRKAVQRLDEKGRSALAIVAALRAIKIAHGDGKPINAADVERWLAGGAG